GTGAPHLVADAIGLGGPTVVRELGNGIGAVGQRAGLYLLPCRDAVELCLRELAAWSDADRRRIEIDRRPQVLERRVSDPVALQVVGIALRTSQARRERHAQDGPHRDGLHVLEGLLSR